MPNTTTSPQDGWKSKLTSIVAIIILLAFAWLYVYMIRQLDSAETYWTRALYLFGAVQALAFAAAGYLFGKDVSREQTTKAEKQADDAKQDAKQALQQASTVLQEATTATTKAKDIVAAVKAQATGLGVSQTYSALGATPQHTQAVQSVLQQLAKTVEDIYNA